MKRAKIDWAQVRERLRTSERALEETWALNPQRVQDAYRQRAIKLAQVESRLELTSAGFSALAFRLGEERYAIEMTEVAEVLPFHRCVSVPGGSRQFLGVMNVRGELRAVLNLKNLVAPSDSECGEAGFVVMLRRPGKEIGLKVDAIEDLQEIRQTEGKPLPQGSYGRALVSGISVLLNVDAVLEAAFSKEESLTA